MKYLTGVHALNLSCNLDTCGDWHFEALPWKNLTIRESDNMFFGDYGIEEEKKLPFSEKRMPVANHIRACLDLIQEGKFRVAQGMNKDYISNGKYDLLIFSKVYSMRNLENWKEIDKFMGKEYMMKWLNFKKEKENK